MGFDPSTTKPEIDFPGDTAPTALVIEDLVLGDGAEAKAGDSISAHYVGVAHSTGEEFDASWNRGAPLDFTLGVGQVIKGWDDGIVGMDVDCFEVAAEGLTDRDGTGEPPGLGQPGHGAGEGDGQGAPVAHHVDSPGLRDGVAQARQNGRDCGVKVSHDDGHLVDPV